jgi:hypothetical protein
MSVQPVGDCRERAPRSSLGSRVVQESAIVVVFVAETRVIPPDVFCAVPGYLDHLSVRLSKPIRSRVLVDGVSASAVPL